MLNFQSRSGTYLALTSIIQVLRETKLQDLLCPVSLCFIRVIYIFFYIDFPFIFLFVCLLVFYVCRTLFKLALFNANTVVPESKINEQINVA